MATTVYMEALSPTMEEGRLVKWNKEEGDAVKTGESLAEVETDKAVMELVARADGNLINVLVPEGKTVPVGSVVAYIGAPGEKVEGGAGGGERGATKPAAAPEQPRTAPAAPVTAPAPVGETDRIKASPLARRIARDSGLDLQRVQGSGPGGRVVKRDLEGAGSREPGAVRPAATPAAAPRAPLPAPPPIAVTKGGAPFEDVPLTQIRKTIARRLATSLGPIPHFFLTTEVDMERAAEARDSLNQQLADTVRISFNDIIIKATALALTNHRACNAWFQDDHIRYWNEVHIGMAAAVQDRPITPVGRDRGLQSHAPLG